MRSSRLLLLCALLLCAAAAARGAQPADLFDFWLGEWQLSWTNADGSTGHGRNVVAKILDGRVIEERFEEDASAATPLRGHSVSVLQRASGLWRQSWVDNQGGYFSFTGAADGDKRIFATDLVERDGKTVGQRMVFHSFRKDGFTWDWESTADGGKSWKRAWRIEYQRAASAH